MILHLEDKCMTKEEKKELELLASEAEFFVDNLRRCQRETKEAFKKAGKDRKNYKSEEEAEYIFKWAENNTAANEIKRNIRERYVRSISGRARKINADAKKILNALEYEDFLDWAHDELLAFHMEFKEVNGRDPTAEELETRDKEKVRCRDGCSLFLRLILSRQFSACRPEYNEEGREIKTDRLHSLINIKLAEWDFQQQQEETRIPSLFDNSNFPMYHGKPTDTLARMHSRTAELNEISGNAALESGQLKVVMKKFKDLKASLGVNTHKLLSVGVAMFTSINSYNRKGKSSLQYTVEIPLEEYALAIGYIKSAARETEEEKRKYNNAKKDAKRKIKNDLETLGSTELSWKEAIAGESADYENMTIIGTRGIRNDYIKMTFDPEFSKYLARLPITQYPVSLLAVDARNQNAYSMGLKLAEHYNIYNNQEKGTASRLKIERLLDSSAIPSYDDVAKSRKGWVERIKEPFEKALDELTDKNVLKDWKYTASKGAELSYEEATTTVYEQWKELFIEFELADPVDHTARLERRAEERKAIETKPKKKTTKKKA